MSGGNIGDLALHFINRLNMMVVKVQSKFDLRRLCKVTGATPLARVVRFQSLEQKFFVYSVIRELPRPRRWGTATMSKSLRSVATGVWCSDRTKHRTRSWRPS